MYNDKQLAVVTKKVKITEDGKPKWLTATAELHSIGNQKPYFSITGEVASVYRPNSIQSCGCLHELIAMNFRRTLAPYIKWHLTDCTGNPMHYLANALYHYDQGKEEYFKSTVVFGAVEGDETDFAACQTRADVEIWLKKRLWNLQAEFRIAMLTLFGPTVAQHFLYPTKE